MSIISKLSGKNQTTIPKAVVQALRIRPSSLLVYEIEPDGRVWLSTKSATFTELADQFPTPRRRKPATDKQIQAAIREGAARRFKKAGDDLPTSAKSGHKNHTRRFRKAGR